ncbi:MAG: NAD-dependent epimerase/dehydratase family protein [Myxococcales bacterium]|nr:NAD-dependent epimerase/dehydratase family protein [Myxococcales bacterium]
MLRVFITGATGFLGYALGRELLEAGHTVVALSRTGSLAGDLSARGAEVFRGHLGDVARLCDGMRGCSLVFHVAADVNMWRARWSQSVETNVIGTKNVAEAALRAQVERLVYTSSAATIGKPFDAPSGTLVDERSEYNLAAQAMVYPHTKWLGECAVADAAARGLDTVTTHPAAIFGPWDFKHNLLPLFRAARGRAPLPVPNGMRTTCDVRDVAHAHVVAATSAESGAHYILGGEWVTVRQLFSAVGQALGRSRPTFTLPDTLIVGLGRSLDVVSDLTGRPPLLSREMAVQSAFRVRLSSAKAKAELGYQSRPLAQSLADAVAWYRETGAL